MTAEEEVKARDAAKTEAQKTLYAAEKAWYAYASMCDLGIERERAFEIYENVRTATRR
jgi:hypothetical protein